MASAGMRQRKVSHAKAQRRKENRGLFELETLRPSFFAPFAPCVRFFPTLGREPDLFRFSQLMGYT
jgi:hypothetical protein